MIGDPALFLDHEAAGLTKIDLGAEWTRMTGLPFVWAFWAGRPRRARRRRTSPRCRRRGTPGSAHSDAIADAYCGAERAARLPGVLEGQYQVPAGTIARSQGLRRYYELRERSCDGVRRRRDAVDVCEFY